MSTTASMIEQLRDLFERFGSEYYGENASQLAHALQCAHLARLDGCSDSLIAAALLHDVGQFLDDSGNAAEKLNTDALHEHTGADYLAEWFSEAVTEPVRMHVAAKRYLCSAEPDYIAGLSAASLLSLRLQGGPMSPDEGDEFAGRPFAQDAIRLRRYDDAGKQPGIQAPALASYFPLLERLASGAD